MMPKRSYPYHELARHFAGDLLLGNDHDSPSWSLELLCQASTRLYRAERIYSVQFECLPLSAADLSELKEVVSLNKDAVSLTLKAIQQGDFRLAAGPFYGVRRVDERINKMTGRPLRSLLAILLGHARLQIHEGNLREAIAWIGRLMRLSNMLCAGAGEMPVYYTGIDGRDKAVFLLRECLWSPYCEIGTLRALSAVLGSRIASTDGYLQSQYSDYFRDVLVTFARNGDYFSSQGDLARWLRTPLVGALSTFGHCQWQPNQPPAAGVEFKIPAVIAALASNSCPLDAVETTSELARLYELSRDAFPDRLESGMSRLVQQSTGGRSWPEEFQFTSGYAAPVPESLVAHTAREVSGWPNALGTLILRDIARVADSLAQRNLVVPWKGCLGWEITRLMIADREYQLRFGELPGSVEELCEAGILADEPIDALTHVPLSISQDRQSIIGPSNEEIGKRMMAKGMPELKWAIPMARPDSGKGPFNAM